jgi:type VI secretion system protein ImpA
MLDSATNGSALPPPASLWLLPLDDGLACGPDLEYDAEALELSQAGGRPESQFGQPAAPPDWARVRELAESLFARTRDLRVALWWGRARLHLDGFAALPEALALLHGLLDRFWDELHPLPDADEPDALARLSVIGGLDKLDSLLGDVRNSRLSDDRRLDGLRVRDVEVALGKVPPRRDEATRSQGQIVAMLADAPDVAAALRAQTDAASAALQQIQALMGRRFSAHLAVDVGALRAMLSSIGSVLPGAAVDAAEAGQPDADAAAALSEGGAPLPRPAGALRSINSRQEAIRAIELVCAYLERSEPTNPAQLLLRRAARVIDKNFLELMRELAPDSVKDVARLMGVDPSSIADQN